MACLGCLPDMTTTTTPATPAELTPPAVPVILRSHRVPGDGRGRGPAAGVVVRDQQAVRVGYAGRGPDDDAASVSNSARVRHALRHDPMFWIGATLATLLVSVAVLAPVLAPYDPFREFRKLMPLDGSALPPSSQFLLGTDISGRDYLSRAIYGARATLLIGLLASIIASVLGLLVGVTAAYAGTQRVPVGSRALHRRAGRGHPDAHHRRRPCLPGVAAGHRSGPIDGTEHRPGHRGHHDRAVVHHGPHHLRTCPRASRGRVRGRRPCLGQLGLEHRPAPPAAVPRAAGRRLRIVGHRHRGRSSRRPSPTSVSAFRSRPPRGAR